MFKTTISVTKDPINPIQVPIATAAMLMKKFVTVSSAPLGSDAERAGGDPPRQSV